MVDRDRHRRTSSGRLEIHVVDVRFVVGRTSWILPPFTEYFDEFAIKFAGTVFVQIKGHGRSELRVLPHANYRSIGGSVGRWSRLGFIIE